MGTLGWVLPDAVLTGGDIKTGKTSETEVTGEQLTNWKSFFSCSSYLKYHKQVILFTDVKPGL